MLRILWMTFLPLLLLGSTGCERLVSATYKGSSAAFYSVVRPDRLAIHDYVAKGDYAAVRQYLRLYPKRVNSKANADAGRRPLHVAVENNDVKMVGLLIRLGANVSGRDHLGRTPLYLAMHAADPFEVVGLLLDAGAKSELSDRIGIAPLHLAARRGRDELVRELVRYGAPVDAVTLGEGLTPLMLAVLDLDLEVAEVLLVHGADANLPSKQGATALDLAVQRRGSKIIERLRREGAVRGTGLFSGAEFEDIRFQ